MKDDNIKKALMEAAKRLLSESETPEDITSRQIASLAGTNAAMINYYFGSKDALMSKAVEQLLDAASEIFHAVPDPADSPKERLRKILYEICVVVLKYQSYTKIYVPHLLLEDEISLPFYILPQIREHFGEKKDETRCRIIAYQLVSFLQLAFYRSNEFLHYTGLNLSEKEACERLIDFELELFLPEGEKDESYGISE